MSSTPVFSFRPQAELLEALEFRTDILTAWDGTEQRIRLREAPRQSFEMEVWATGAARSRLDLLLAGYHGWTYLLPVWPEQAALSSLLSAGSGVVPITTTAGDYRVGSQALLWSSCDDYEAVEISEVWADALILDGATTTSRDYPAGSLVLPLREARLLEQYRREDYPGDLSPCVHTLRWVVEDNLDLVGTAAPDQYLGHDVLVDPYLLPAETIERSFERELDTVDPLLGAWKQFARTQYPLATTEVLWRMGTPATAWAFRRFLHRRAGRCNPVWIPSWRPDLELLEPAGAGASQITVTDVGYRFFGLDRPTFRDVAIMPSAGGQILRRVTAAVAGDPGEEILTLSATLGQAITPATVARISFLALSRLAADRVEILWPRAGLAEIRAALVGVAQ
jgi:hypothetical protein